MSNLGKTVYIDIRRNTIKYIALKRGLLHNAFDVLGFGSIKLPFDFYENLSSREFGMVSVLKKLFEKEKLTGMKAKINIASPRIITRTVKIPFMPHKEISNYLDMEIDQYLPVDATTVRYGYKVLEQLMEDDKKLYSLFIASVPKEIIEDCAYVMQASGIEPIMIDVYANAVSSLFEHENGRDIIIADIDEGTLDFVFLEKGKLFIHVNIPIDTKIRYQEYYSKDIEQLMETDYQFSREMFEIAKNMKTYLEFYASRNYGKSADVIYIVGELSLLDNVEKYFSSQFNISVKVGLPENLKIKSSTGKGGMTQSLGKYHCGIGLALAK